MNRPPPHFSHPEEDTTYSVVLKATSLFLFFFVGIYGNGRVIYTVLVADLLRPPLNLFVASLSIADLITCIVIMPFTFASLITAQWLFGQGLCQTLGITQNYLAHVVAFSTSAVVYERYRAIYRKRYPSLSHRQVIIFLCVVWFLPVVFTAIIGRRKFVYMRLAGTCLDKVENREIISNACLVKIIVFSSLAFLFVFFAVWKILAYLLSIRPRVSPGLLSNEEKLTVAAHNHSAWTTIIFVLIYLALVLPMQIDRLVNQLRIRAGERETAEDVKCVFLWLYWSQCAIKPLIYVIRSERFTCRFCQRLPRIRNEATSRFVRRRNRGHVYENRDAGLEIDGSNLTSRGQKASSSQEFFEPNNQPVDVRTFQIASRLTRDDTADQSMIVLEELVINSIIETNEENHADRHDRDQQCEGCHGNTNVIPSGVCHEAEELENIEQMFDEALKAQQRKWDNHAAARRH